MKIFLEELSKIISIDFEQIAKYQCMQTLRDQMQAALKSSSSAFKPDRHEHRLSKAGGSQLHCHAPQRTSAVTATQPNPHSNNDFNG